MARESVSSAADPRIAIYRDLRHVNLTAAAGRFIVEGRLLVDRLLASEFPVESLLVEERFADVAWPVDRHVPIYVVPQGMVSEIIGFKFHRGVLGYGRRRPSPSLAEVLHASPVSNAAVEPLTRPRLTLVVAVDIQDPENLGTVIRNSAAFGVQAVITTPQCADPFSRRVLRTSMGTVFAIPIIATRDLPETLRQLSNEYDISSAATILAPNAIPLSEFQRPPRLAVLFGNEGHGLPPEIVSLCTHAITMPMHGSIDSLNVGVASGVFLYQLTQAASISRAPTA
ncbi:MAG: rRNA (guanosine-2-O-)-methyltransferase RlmB [Planctomycetota bacterium]